jgi:hypothetical protein
MVEVAEVAENGALLGEAFQKIVSDGRLIALIFEYDDQHVVEMLWGSGGSGVLGKAENRAEAERYACKSEAVPVPERHVSSKSQSLAVGFRSVFSPGICVAVWRRL